MSLESMKHEYQSIPVPEEAKERIRRGIRQAKAERRRTFLFKTAKTSGFTAAAAMAAIVVGANLSPITARAMEQIPVVGSIAKVFTFRTFTDQQNGYQANIQVPQITMEGDTQQVNQSIQEYADQLIQEYEKELASAQGEGHYSMDSSYEVVSDGSRYLCLRINTTVVMASGTQYVKIFTVDKTTGNTVALTDLFDSRTLEAISDNIKEQMVQQMAQDENITYFYQSDLPETDFQGLKGDENFYLDSQGQLVIVFDEYQVAPGYMGAVEFTIPQSVTGELES